MKLYSRTTGSFYNSFINGANIPADVVGVTDTEYALLMAGQSNGQCIISDSNGKPKLQATPVPTVASIKAAKLLELAAKRYEIETGGITVNGSTISTDRDSQAMLTSAWVIMQMTPNAVIDWKAPTGWVKLNKAAIEPIAMAVSTHVQACFTAESIHAAAINKLKTEEELNDYDIATGWPM